MARITINRPEALNAFTTNTQSELIKALQDAADDAHIGVVVLTGAGDKAFYTGGDAKASDCRGKWLCYRRRAGLSAVL